MAAFGNSNMQTGAAGFQNPLAKNKQQNTGFAAYNQQAGGAQQSGQQKTGFDMSSYSQQGGQQAPSFSSTFSVGPSTTQSFPGMQWGSQGSSQIPAGQQFPAPTGTPQTSVSSPFGQQMDPASFFAQRDAFIQQVNDNNMQRAAQSGVSMTGQAGPPMQRINPQNMWNQAGEMVQGGWTNPFAQMQQTQSPIQQLFSNYGIQAPQGFMDQLLGMLGQQAPPQQLGPSISRPQMNPQFQSFDPFGTGAPTSSPQVGTPPDSVSPFEGVDRNGNIRLPDGRSVHIESAEGRLEFIRRDSEARDRIPSTVRPKQPAPPVGGLEYVPYSSSRERMSSTPAPGLVAHVLSPGTRSERTVYVTPEDAQSLAQEARARLDPSEQARQVALARQQASEVGRAQSIPDPSQGTPYDPTQVAEQLQAAPNQVASAPVVGREIDGARVIDPGSTARLRYLQKHGARLNELVELSEPGKDAQQEWIDTYRVGEDGEWTPLTQQELEQSRLDARGRIKEKLRVAPTKRNATAGYDYGLASQKGAYGDYAPDAKTEDGMATFVPLQDPSTGQSPSPESLAQLASRLPAGWGFKVGLGGKGSSLVKVTHPMGATAEQVRAAVGGLMRSDAGDEGFLSLAGQAHSRDYRLGVMPSPGGAVSSNAATAGSGGSQRDRPPSGGGVRTGEFRDTNGNGMDDRDEPPSQAPGSARPVAPPSIGTPYNPGAPSQGLPEPPTRTPSPGQQQRPKKQLQSFTRDQLATLANARSQNALGNMSNEEYERIQAEISIAQGRAGAVDPKYLKNNPTYHKMMRDQQIKNWMAAGTPVSD